jgi:hypothetical protein
VPQSINQAVGRPTLGSDAWKAANPPFGSTFTVLVPALPETAAEARRAEERELRAAGRDVPFPGYEALRAERTESSSRVMLRISDDAGAVVRWVPVPAREGVHRVTWDLRRPAPDPVSFSNPDFQPPWVSDPEGPLAAPGAYTAQLVHVNGSSVEEVGAAQPFDVVPVPALADGTDFRAVAEHHARSAELRREISITASEMAQASERVRYMRAALERTPGAAPSLYGALDELDAALEAFRLRLNGDPVRGGLNQSQVPSISGRAYGAAAWGTTQIPTGTQRENLRVAEGDFAALRSEVAAFLEGAMLRVERALAEAGAPWTPGRRIGG